MKTRDLIVHRLQCGHCGAELPVMGRSVTFRCGACRRLWAADGERLRPVMIDRALVSRDESAEQKTGDILYLPFWVIEIDLPRLDSAVSKIMKTLRETQSRLAGASLIPDDRGPDPLTELGLNLIGLDAGPSETVRVVPGAAMALPSSAELEHFLRTIAERGVFRVFVPAFDSPGEHVRLSVGRLMTQRRPELRTEASDGSGRTAVPVVPSGEALALAGYVFFSIFPHSIGSCAGFMGRIEVRHAADPLLVEFPFAHHGGELESLVGGFHIPARLVGVLAEEPAGA